MILPLWASSKLEKPVHRTASVCGSRGAGAPVETNFAVEQAASRGSAAKPGAASMASSFSERGSKNGRDKAAVTDTIAPAATRHRSVPRFIVRLPSSFRIKITAPPHRESPHPRDDEFGAFLGA